MVASVEVAEEEYDEGEEGCGHGKYAEEAGQYAFFAGWGVAVCVCEEPVDEVSDAVDCGEEGLGDGDGEEEYHEGADEGLVLWGHVVAADDGCCCYGEDE